MGLHTCGRRLKIVGLLLHTVLLVGAISMLGVAAWAGSTGSRVELVMGSNVHNCGFILMTMGVLVVLFNLMGCLAVQTENKCLILVYVVVSFLTLIIIVVGITLTFVFREQLTQSAHNSMMASISQDYEGQVDVQTSWDTIQQQLRCCGVASINNSDPPYKAWRQSRMFMSEETPPYVPVSCCLRTEEGEFIDRTDCLNMPPSNLTVYERDCEEAAIAMIRDNGMVLAAVSVCVACIMILSVGLSCTICSLIE